MLNQGLSRCRHVSLATCERGVAAIEFAFIAPVMFLLISGFYDVTEFFTLKEQVYNAAHTIPLSASILAVQPDHSTSLTAVQAQQTMSMVFAEVPTLHGGKYFVPGAVNAVVMSSVVFTPNPAACVSSATVTCNYVGNVAWSVSYGNPSVQGTAPLAFASRLRPCSAVTTIAPGSYYSPGGFTQLPVAAIVTASNSIPPPILVVDVGVTFAPLFYTFITGPIQIWATGLWPIRASVAGSAPATQYTKYDIARTQGGVFNCPGYP